MLGGAKPDTGRGWRAANPAPGLAAAHPLPPRPLRRHHERSCKCKAPAAGSDVSPFSWGLAAHCMGTGSRTGGCPWSCRTGEVILPWKGINGDKDEHRELRESIQGIPSSLKRWHLSARGNSSSFSPHLSKVLVLVLPRRPMLSSAAIPQPSHQPRPTTGTCRCRAAGCRVRGMLGPRAAPGLQLRLESAGGCGRKGSRRALSPWTPLAELRLKAS